MLKLREGALTTFGNLALEAFHVEWLGLIFGLRFYPWTINGKSYVLLAGCLQSTSTVEANAESSTLDDRASPSTS